LNHYSWRLNEGEECGKATEILDGGIAGKIQDGEIAARVGEREWDGGEWKKSCVECLW